MFGCPASPLLERSLVLKKTANANEDPRFNPELEQVAGFRPHDQAPGTSGPLC